MYNLILQLFLFSSLGTIIFLFARAVPRVTDEKEAVHPASFFDKILTRLPLATIDNAVNAFFEKTLRKSKVVVLKLDNIITGYLGRLKKTNGALKEGKELFNNTESDDSTGEKKS